MTIPPLSEMQYKALESFNKQWERDRQMFGDKAHQARRMARAYYMSAYMLGASDMAIAYAKKAIQNISDDLDKLNNL